MKRISLCYFLIMVPGFILAQLSEPVKYLSLEPYDFHLAYLRQDSVLLIDVREPFEFRKKRIRGAVNLPSSGDLEFASDTIDKCYSLFFYCTSGTRSKRVAARFYDRGFRKLYNLEGGLTAWKKEKFPLTRKSRLK